jgi:NTE family protein
MYNNKKIAVVLGGGGIKPFASLPLFYFFEKKNIKPDIIVGCSGGAILSSMIGTGIPFETINKDIIPQINSSLFQKNWKFILSLIGIPFLKTQRADAILKPQRMMKLMHNYLGNTKIEETNPKIILQATDYLTGESVALEHGDLAKSVYASAAIYPFLPPVEINKRWLFDGGFSSPVPVLQAVRQSADVIIALDFLEKIHPDPKGIFNIIMHIPRFLTKTVISQQMALSIDLHDAEIFYIKVYFEKYVPMWQTESLPYIIEAGKNAVNKSEEELLKLLNF